MPENDVEPEALGERLAEAGARIEPLLAELYPPGAADYLAEPFWYHMGAGGKRIRPALCLLACEALGGEADRALPFAAAVEVLHNMFLVHDDVEDGDTMRRDSPAVWVKYGVPNAVNLGDDMLARAYRLLLRSPVGPERKLELIDAFTDAYERTCRGQSLDMNARGREDFTVDDYLETVTLKTGHYLALGMVGGAIVAGAEAAVVEQIRGLGRSMGPAFQMRDDVIDLTRGKGRGGALGNDICEGKASILYARALEVSDDRQRGRLLEIMRRDRAATTADDVAWVLALYERSGCLEFARRKADELVGQAFRTIELLPVRNKEFFRNAARFMARRTS